MYCLGIMFCFLSHPLPTGLYLCRVGGHKACYWRLTKGCCSRPLSPLAFPCALVMFQGPGRGFPEDHVTF
jgi:hypothetical protein